MSAAPTCPSCRKPGRLTNGVEIWPHRPDLATKHVWICDGCGAYVGCHPGTTTALGTLANAALRAVRLITHAKMDPLWKNAPATLGRGKLAGKARRRIQKRARQRVYAFLADRLGLTPEQTHVGMFDLEQCRAAWRALDGITYAEIREWAKAREDARRAA